MNTCRAGLVGLLAIVLTSSCASTNNRADKFTKPTADASATISYSPASQYSQLLPIDERSPAALGRGYDSLASIYRGDAIDIQSATIRPAEAFGQQTQFDMIIESSSSRLSRELNLSAGLSIGSFFASGSGSASFGQIRRESRWATFLAARIRIVDTAQTVQKPQLTSSAKSLLDRDRQAFYAAYGDTFVRSIVTGGELILLFQLEHSTSEQQTQFRADFKYKAPFVSGFASVFSNLTQESAYTNISLSVFRRGGRGEGTTPNFQNVADVAKAKDEVLKYASDFAAQVAAKPSLCFAEVVDYAACEGTQSGGAPSFFLTRPVVNQCSRILQRAAEVLIIELETAPLKAKVSGDGLNDSAMVYSINQKIQEYVYIPDEIYVLAPRDPGLYALYLEGEPVMSFFQPLLQSLSPVDRHFKYVTACQRFAYYYLTAIMLAPVEYEAHLLGSVNERRNVDRMLAILVNSLTAGE